MKKTTKQQKVDWLLRHNSVWESYPSEVATYEKIIQAMKEAGLYSKRNGGPQRHLGELIDMARQQRREYIKRNFGGSFRKDPEGDWAPHLPKPRHGDPFACECPALSILWRI